jgi:hypothetical protein
LLVASDHATKLAGAKGLFLPSDGRWLEISERSARFFPARQQNLRERVLRIIIMDRLEKQDFKTIKKGVPDV